MDMALIIVDQESELKQYFCKICKKGFGCGRALGGHMRAHGIGYDDHSFDYDHMEAEEDEEEDDHSSDWEDNDVVVAPTNNNDKKLYGLRTNPNRLKTTRICENCDKEFLSWKSFLEHKAANKCTSDDADSVVSSADHQDYSSLNTGWSKRKRSMRAKVISTEEEDLAKCLMLLSNAGNTMIVDDDDQPEESCASASKDDHEDRKLRPTTKTIQMIIPPSPKTAKLELGNNINNTYNKGAFECKACKKVFNSHQALGGHRASHKKVKGCFAAAAAADEDVMITLQHDDTFFLPKFHPAGSVNNKRKMSGKVHECSICHRVFSSGQALGGHKRCHWITSNNNNNSSSSTAAKLIHLEKSQQIINRRNKNTTSVDLSLELNLHASPPTNNDGHLKKKKKNENDSAWSMVDDEAESKVKLAKLSELKDINVNNGNSSPWLQVGIGASAALK